MRLLYCFVVGVSLFLLLFLSLSILIAFYLSAFPLISLCPWLTFVLLLWRYFPFSSYPFIFCSCSTSCSCVAKIIVLFLFLLLPHFFFNYTLSSPSSCSFSLITHTRASAINNLPKVLRHIQPLIRIKKELEIISKSYTHHRLPPPPPSHSTQYHIFPPPQPPIRWESGDLHSSSGKPNIMVIP